MAAEKLGDLVKAAVGTRTDFVQERLPSPACRHGRASAGSSREPERGSANMWVYVVSPS